MKILMSALMCLVASVDVFVIALSYGVRKIKIKISYNCIISLTAGIGAAVAMLLAQLVDDLISARVATIVGGAIMIAMGGKLIVDIIIKFFKKRYALSELEKISEKELSSRSVIALALTLAANNAAISVSATFAGLLPLSVAIFSFLFSFIFILLGNLVGRKITAPIIVAVADICSAIIIVTIGICAIVV